MFLDNFANYPPQPGAILTKSELFSFFDKSQYNRGALSKLLASDGRVNKLLQ